MSIYIIIFLTLLLFSIIVMCNLKTEKVLYYISICILGAFLIFRFGQGTDYFGYMRIYNFALESPPFDFGSTFWREHGEIGWKIINQLWVILKLPFWGLVMLVSAVQIWLLHKFVSSWCYSNRCLALTILYPTFYLTYLFSAVREGMVVCIFGGVMLKLWEKKRYKAYILVALISAGIHSVAFLYFIPFILKYIKKIWCEFGLLVSAGIGIGIYALGELGKIQAILPSAVAVHLREETFFISKGALVWRILFGIIMLLLYNLNKVEKNEMYTLLYKFYMVGLNIYLCTMWLPLVASRGFFCIQFCEVVFITSYLMENVQKKIFGVLFILGLVSIMFRKNMESYCAGYNSDIKWYNFPYVTVFNRRKIVKYREDIDSILYLEGYDEPYMKKYLDIR